MGYRAFRDNRDIQSEEIVYRIPGVRLCFVVDDLSDLCQDCSTPVITMRDKRSGKAVRLWHDDTCPTASEEARLKRRVLNRQK